VIIEHDFLEQVAESSFNWSLRASIAFIATHKDPWSVLRALHRDKCLTLNDGKGNPLPTWKTEEIFRKRDVPAGTEVIIKVTEAGIKRVHY